MVQGSPNGTAIYPDMSRFRHGVTASFDAYVLDAATESKPIDPDDPRYWVRRILVQQPSTATSTDNLFSWQQDDGGAQPQGGAEGPVFPGDDVIAYNLHEHEWQSNFLRAGERVTVHQITTVYEGDEHIGEEGYDTPPHFTWWVFDHAFKPVRSATLTANPAACDQSVVAWDERQLRKSVGDRVTSSITIKENGLKASTADQLLAGDVIHYIPTSKTTGFIVGYTEAMHIGAWECNNTYVDAVTDTSMSHLYFHVDDFNVSAALQECHNTVLVKWAGFTVLDDYAQHAIGNVKMLDFSSPGAAPAGGTVYPVYFGISEADMANPLGCPSNVTRTAVVTGSIVLPKTDFSEDLAIDLSTTDCVLTVGVTVNGRRASATVTMPCCCGGSTSGGSSSTGTGTNTTSPPSPPAPGTNGVGEGGTNAACKYLFEALYDPETSQWGDIETLEVWCDNIVAPYGWSQNPLSPCSMNCIVMDGSCDGIGGCVGGTNLAPSLPASPGCNCASL